MFSKDILSIDIGNRYIKIIQGRFNSNKITIIKKIKLKTPMFSYDNGEFIEYDKIKSEIHNILVRYNIKAKKAVCTVNSTKIITREIQLPYANEKDLEKLVYFEIDEYLPIMLSDYVVEYKVLEEFIDNDVRKVKILVAALPKQIAEGYYKLIKDLGLKPVALDLTSNAISKLIKLNINNEFENFSFKETVAFIDLGYSFTNVSIISNGILKISKPLPIGTKEIDLHIANSFNLSLDEAEAKKIENGSLIKKDDNLSIRMLNESIENSINNLLLEVQKVFQYYTTRILGNRIDTIVIYGGGSNLEGISEYFRNYFNIATYKINDLDFITFKKSFDELELDYFLNSISAIIRQ